MKRKEKKSLDSSANRSNALVFPENVEQIQNKNKKGNCEEDNTKSMTKLEMIAWYFVPLSYLLFTAFYFVICTTI